MRRFIGAGRLLFLLCLAALIWPLCSLVAADSLAASAPEKALQWWPWHAEAMVRTTKALVISEGSAEETERLAKRALANSPLAGSAYAALAAVAEQRGEVSRAARLYGIAAAHTPRDRLPHLWLTDHAARNRDFPLLIAHLDQLFRLSPDRSAALLQTLASLAGDPQGRQALIEALMQAPPWRGPLLAGLAAPDQPLEVIHSLFDALRHAPSPLTSKERQQWGVRLLREGLVAQAHLLWVEGLEPARRATVGNVHDGGFEFPPDHGGFGWQFSRVPGAVVRQQGGAGVSGRQALVVEFQHRHVPFRHVRQVLALPPGDYRLSGRVRLDDLRTDRGLVWSVRCGSGEMAQTPMFSGSAPWRAFEVDFSIPEAPNCRAQQLLLMLPARVKRERWIGGRAWFDDLRIQRIAAVDQN